MTQTKSAPAITDLTWTKLSYVLPTEYGHYNGLIWIGLDADGVAWADTGTHWAHPSGAAPLASILTPDTRITVPQRRGDWRDKYVAISDEVSDRLRAALGSYLDTRTII